MSWISDAPGVQPDGVPDEGGVVLGGDLQLELAAPVALVVLLPGVRKFILVVYAVDFFLIPSSRYTKRQSYERLASLFLQACEYKSFLKSHVVKFNPPTLLNTKYFN